MSSLTTLDEGQEIVVSTADGRRELFSWPLAFLTEGETLRLVSVVDGREWRTVAAYSGASGWTMVVRPTAGPPGPRYTAGNG